MDWPPVLAGLLSIRISRTSERVREGRAPRIQISVVEGTTRQAKAPRLGLRWVWILGLSGRP